LGACARVFERPVASGFASRAGANAFGAGVQSFALKSNEMCRVIQLARGGRSRLQLCCPHEAIQIIKIIQTNKNQR
jgi:hypothetical protein